MTDAVKALIAAMTRALDASDITTLPKSRPAIVVNIGILAGHAATVLAAADTVPAPHEPMP